MDKDDINRAAVLGLLSFVALCAWGVALGNLYRMYVG